MMRFEYGGLSGLGAAGDGFASFASLREDQKQVVTAISAAITAAHKVITRERRRPGNSASLPNSDPKILEALKLDIVMALRTAHQAYSEAWAPEVLGAPFKIYMPITVYEFLTNRGGEADLQRSLEALTAMSGAVEVISVTRFEQLPTMQVTVEGGGMRGLGGGAVAIVIAICVVLSLAALAWIVNSATKTMAVETETYAKNLQRVTEACPTCSPQELKELIAEIPKPTTGAGLMDAAGKLMDKGFKIVVVAGGVLGVLALAAVLIAYRQPLSALAPKQ